MAVKNKFTISDDAVFINKHTGEVLSEDSVQRIIRANGGRISMQHRINKYGITEAYIVDVLSKDGMTYGRQGNAPGIVGEVFPPFAMTSTSGELIDSDSLRGNWIILHFTIPFRNSAAEKEGIERMGSYLAEIPDQRKLTYVRVTTYSPDPAIQSAIQVPDYWKYISNGSPFQQRYGIMDYPSFYLINPQGELVELLKSVDYATLKSELLSLQSK
jgi:cytochrome oxidase Cu insertion factor (SCO1/SenC/PrrC family)